MSDEQNDALLRAARWCDSHDAVVAWSPGEHRCTITVRAPHEDGVVVVGEGSGYYEAYIECRVRHDALAVTEPPSWF